MAGGGTMAQLFLNIKLKQSQGGRLGGRVCVKQMYRESRGASTLLSLTVVGVLGESHRRGEEEEKSSLQPFLCSSVSGEEATGKRRGVEGSGGRTPPILSFPHLAQQAPSEGTTG